MSSTTVHLRCRSGEEGRKGTLAIGETYRPHCCLASDEKVSETCSSNTVSMVEGSSSENCGRSVVWQSVKHSHMPLGGRETFAKACSPSSGSTTSPDISAKNRKLSLPEARDYAMHLTPFPERKRCAFTIASILAKSEDQQSNCKDVSFTRSEETYPENLTHWESSDDEQLNSSPTTKEATALWSPLRSAFVQENPHYAAMLHQTQLQNCLRQLSSPGIFSAESRGAFASSVHLGLTTTSLPSSIGRRWFSPYSSWTHSLSMPPGCSYLTPIDGKYLICFVKFTFASPH